MRWRSFSSIHELPPSLWADKVSRGRCTTSPEFLAALERTYPEQRYRYFVAYEEIGEGEGERDVVVGCAMLNVMRHDLSLEMPQLLRRAVAGVRRVWPRFSTLGLAMTGTLESYGDHYWYDAERVELGDFLDGLLEQVQGFASEFSVLVVRDYIVEPGRDAEVEAVREALRGHACTMGEALPVSELDLRAYDSPEAYLSGLKSRDRYTIRKANKRAAKQGVALEFVDDYAPLLDELYPLYLAVNERAQELVTAPLPLAFFVAVKQEFGPRARVLTARDAAGGLLAFALVIETNTNMEIFAVGMDYEAIGKQVSMYNLLWACICEAIRGGHERVELGVTNYFIKQRFGAQVYPMKVFYRASSRALESVLRGAFEIGEIPELAA